MPREYTLFERLSDPSLQEQRTVNEDVNALVRSILNNLRRLLNAREGHAAAQMDLGTMSPTDIALKYPDSINEAQRRVRECIEKYEPRLSDVNVMWIESEEDMLSLRFQITGRLATSSNRNAVLSFDTVFDPSGEIKLHN